MKMPQEIEVWYVLPTIRRVFANGFIKSGLSQRKVAKILGITEAAVSQYVKKKRGLTNIKFDKSTNKKIGMAIPNIIKDNSLTPVYIQEVCTDIRNSKLMCELHKKYDKDLPEVCKLCELGHG